MDALLYMAMNLQRGAEMEIVQTCFDVNVKGTFLSCQVIGGRMASVGRGSIVNVSSIYGMLSPVQDLYEFRRARGETYVKPVAYSVSKGGMMTLTRNAASTLNRYRIRVNQINVGWTLTEGEDFTFVGVPSFAPEIVRRVRLTDAMKAKKLKEALQQMSEEGVVQVFRPLDGAPALVGVVGPLQLDVLKVRLADEYGLDIDFDVPEFQLARWIASADARKLDDFVQANYANCAADLDGDKVFMARNQFILEYTAERAPGIIFTDIKDVKKKVA